MAIIAPRGHYGYSTIVEPGHQTIQRDTVQCGHCDTIIDLKPGSGHTVYLIFVAFDALNRPVYKEEMGAFCGVCMRPVCLPCHGIGTCIPLEKMLETMERPR